MRDSRCKYCNDEKMLAESSNCWAFIRHDYHNGGYALTVNENVHYSEVSVHVNYCPMCGRKLGGDAE